MFRQAEFSLRVKAEAMTSDSKTGLSRRDVIKRGAVAGAVAWSVPMISSSPAFAATSRCHGSRPCVDWYYVKFENGGYSEGCGDGAGSPCPSFGLDTLGCEPLTDEQTLNCSGGKQYVDGSHGGQSGYFKFQPNVIPVKIQIKPGNNCITFNYVEGASQNQPLPVSGVVNNQGIAVNCYEVWVSNPSLSAGIQINYKIADPCMPDDPNNDRTPGVSHIGTYFCV